MNIALWIILCLLAILGLAGSVRGLIRRSERTAHVRTGYYVLPLYGGAAQTEALLRRNLARAKWNGGGTLLLLDMGADAESLAICEKMMGRSGLLCCQESRFFDTVRRLDALQERTAKREKE